MSVRTPSGTAHYIFLDTFDPRLILENTLHSTTIDMFYVGATHRNVSVILSRQEVRPGTEYLMVCVSGGSMGEQQSVIAQFSEFLTRSSERGNWRSVSLQEISPQRNLYIWEVNLANTQ